LALAVTMLGGRAHPDERRRLGARGDAAPAQLVLAESWGVIVDLRD
jgi:hypothetical protein